MKNKNIILSDHGPPRVFSYLPSRQQPFVFHSGSLLASYPVRMIHISPRHLTCLHQHAGPTSLDEITTQSGGLPQTFGRRFGGDFAFLPWGSRCRDTCHSEVHPKTWRRHHHIIISVPNHSIFVPLETGSSSGWWCCHHNRTAQTEQDKAVTPFSIIYYLLVLTTTTGFQEYRRLFFFLSCGQSLSLSLSLL